MTNGWKRLLGVLGNLAIGWLMGAVVMVLIYSVGWLVLMNIPGFTKTEAQSTSFMIGLACWPAAIIFNLWRGWRRRHPAKAP